MTETEQYFAENYGGLKSVRVVCFEYGIASERTN